MTDLLTLSQQCETAGPEETRGLLKDASKLLHPEWWWPTQTVEGCEVSIPFFDLLDINTQEAFLGAAMMLVPEGWETAIYLGGENANVQMETEAMRQRIDFFPIDATAATPALALVSAILLAEAAKQEKV